MTGTCLGCGAIELSCDCGHPPTSYSRASHAKAQTTGCQNALSFDRRAVFCSAVWSLFATLVVAAIAIGVQKWFLVNVDGWLWAMQWLGGAMAVGLLGAIVWTWWVRKPELAAAIEIDRRFGLKERVSSSLALSADDLQTPAGQAPWMMRARVIGWK